MNVFKLDAAIGLNTDSFKKGLASAGESMSAMGDKIKSGAAAVGKAATAAFATVATATAGVTAAVIKGVDAYTTYGDNIDKMSQKLGMSAEAYQEWDAVMQHSGTSIDAMQAGMKTLANAVESGNEAFSRLGITQEELATLNNEQLFSRTISALQNVDNETERTYLAGQLLGRGATELGALLNTSAEDTEKMKQRVHELGGVMSDEAVKAAAAYKDSVQDLKAAFGGIFRSVGGDFVPAFTKITDGLTNVLAGDDSAVNQVMEGIDSVLGTLENSASKIKPIAQRLGSIALKALPEIAKTVGKGIIKAVPQIVDAGKEALGAIFDAFANSGLGVFDWIREDIADVVDAFKTVFGNIDFSKIIDAASGLWESFERIGEQVSWVYTEFLAPAFEWAANDILPTFFEGLGAAADIATAAFDLFKTPALAIWENFVKPMSQGALEIVVGGLKGIADVVKGVEWSGFWEDLFNGNFGEDWKEGWKEIKNRIGDAGKAIDDFFDTSDFARSWNNFWQGVGATVYDFQKEKLDPFIDDWVAGFKDIKKFVSDVKTGFTDFADAVVAGWGMIGDAIDGFIQAHKDGIEMIEDFLGGNQTVSVNEDAMAEFFGKANAKALGGISHKPEVALIGEAGDEATIPLYNDNLGIRQIADAITRNMATASNVINITVNGGNGDPETIAEIIKDKIDTLLNENRVAASRAIGGVAW